MPELPEVETIRRQLEPLVVGRSLHGAWAFPHAKFLPALDAAGAAVEGLGRRGKYLILSLDDGRDLVIHLGMTGSLRVRPPGDEGDGHVRAWWALDQVDGDALEYRDIRRFGRLAVTERGRYRGTLAAQGPDALDPALTADDLWRALRRSRRAVKTQLLSQRPVAGVGNIYADEALWRAGVHPAHRTVTRRQAADLLAAVRGVLDEGIRNGGTTVRDYRAVDGRPGRNQSRLDAYGRAGLPCRRCGTPLRSTVLDGRTTTWCARCQAR
ncbi:MAG: bifunctional DNA-formamidopyrimidine glycosylase/DNA-(apurinic or apyrimidinic site) lyase [Acidimicrobiia bacterium]